MAETYDINNPLTNKLWAKRLWSEFRKADAVLDDKLGLAGSDEERKAFVIKDEMSKSVGDKVTLGISYQTPDDPGTIGDETLEGKEGTIDTADFSLVVDLQRFGKRERGRTMNKQRVHFDVIEVGKRNLRDLWKTRRAVAVCNHLAGNVGVQTATSDHLKYTGLNATAEPDTEHIYRVGQGLGASNDQTVNADDTATFDVDVIDELVTIAEQLTPAIAPIEISGGEYYAMFLHPDVVADIRKNNSQWYNTMLAGLQGGLRDTNPLFTRALGKWRDVLIFSEKHLPMGYHSSTKVYQTNTRRNVFVGAGALAIAYGRNFSGQKEHFSWYSGTWDHGQKFFCSATMVWGVKAVRFTKPGDSARDYGKIVVTSYTTSRTGTAKNFGQPS